MPIREPTVGSRVKISSQAPRCRGRTGVILEQLDPQGQGEQRSWRVRFDWPLGGMGSYAIIAADHLDLLQNMPAIREKT